MKKAFSIVVFFVLLRSIAFAQFDSIVNEMHHEFDQFRQDIEQEHRQFRNKNDSVFA